MNERRNKQISLHLGCGYVIVINYVWSGMDPSWQWCNDLSHQVMQILVMPLLLCFPLKKDWKGSPPQATLLWPHEEKSVISDYLPAHWGRGSLEINQRSFLEGWIILKFHSIPKSTILQIGLTNLGAVAAAREGGVLLSKPQLSSAPSSRSHLLAVGHVKLFSMRCGVLISPDKLCFVPPVLTFRSCLLFTAFQNHNFQCLLKEA